MNVWWLALDLDWTSYDEIRTRRVIAQGWPQIGDLSDLLLLAAEEEKRSEFEEEIRRRCRRVYGPDSAEIQRAPSVMWNLFRVDEGDLLVAIEGTRVRGVVEAISDGRATYCYDARYHYRALRQFARHPRRARRGAAGRL